MKHRLAKICLLALIAFISFAAYFAEVLVRGWGGLAWLSYPHLALIAPPVLFTLWLNYVYDFKLGIVRTVLFALTYAVFFFISFKAYPLAYNFPYIFGWVILAGRMDSWQLWYIFVHIVIFLSLFAANIILKFLLKFHLRAWEYFLLLLLPIPMHFLAHGLLLLLARTDIVPHSNWERDWIYQFKTGTIIFGYMLVEGSYILLHKKDMQGSAREDTQ